MRSRRVLALRLLLVVLAAIAMVLLVRARRRARDRERILIWQEAQDKERAAAEADPANDARPLDAPPWTANPYESQPVTHLRPVHLTSVTDPTGAHQVETDLAASVTGVTVAGGRPVLFSCGQAQPLGPGFVRLRRIKTFDEWSGPSCVESSLRDPRGGRVFIVMDHLDGFIAFDVGAQRIAWTERLPPPSGDAHDFAPQMVLGSAVLAGDQLVVRLTDDGSRACALEAATGAVSWFRPNVAALASDGGALFTLDSAGTLSALDPATANVRWTTALPDFATPAAVMKQFQNLDQVASLAAGGGRVAVAWHEKLAIVDAATGAHLAETTVPGFDETGGPTRLLFHGDELYASANHALVRIDSTKGTPLWSIAGSFDATVRGRDALFALRAVGGDRHWDAVDGVVHAVDPATGKELWSYGAKQRATGMNREVLSLLEVGGSEILAVTDVRSHEIALFQRGPDEMTAKETVLDVTYAGAAAMDTLGVGGERYALDAEHHWRGTLRGRGNVLLSGADPVLVNLDDAGPTTKVMLTSTPHRQACAREK